MNELQRARDCAEKMFASDKASQALGIEIVIPDVGAAVATMRVRDDMLNGFDICHGGFVFRSRIRRLPSPAMPMMT